MVPIAGINYKSICQKATKTDKEYELRIWCSEPKWMQNGNKKKENIEDSQQNLAPFPYSN